MAARTSRYTYSACIVAKLGRIANQFNEQTRQQCVPKMSTPLRTLHSFSNKISIQLLTGTQFAAIRRRRRRTLQLIAKHSTILRTKNALD